MKSAEHKLLMIQVMQLFRCYSSFDCQNMSEHVTTCQKSEVSSKAEAHLRKSLEETAPSRYFEVQESDISDLWAAAQQATAAPSTSFPHMAVAG